MYVLARAKQEAVVSCLVEGCSVRSTERLTGVHRDTVLRLLVRLGTACEALLDSSMRGLRCTRLEVDEIWCFVRKKPKRMTPDDDPRTCGSWWVYVALDPDSKLVPVHLVGKRSGRNTRAFLRNLAQRLANRVRLCSDAFGGYDDAVDRAFGGDVDYGQVIKEYEARVPGQSPDKPQRYVSSRRKCLQGHVEKCDISTSLVERQNLTMRMCMRRFTRKTNAFSKKAANLRAAVALHFAWYNFVRPHRSLRITPAMAAGVADHFWSISDLVGLLC